MLISGSMLVPLIGNAQLDMGPDWSAEKQELVELGLSHGSAWELYQYFERNADDKTLGPDELPDWTGLWNHASRGYDNDRYNNGRVGIDALNAKLKGEYLQMMQEQIDNAAQGRIWDPHSGCGQARGYPGMIKNNRPHEFAVTPHQTWHLGQARNEVRRIYTDGRGHVPEDWAYDTEHGDTIGFWDGDTLVTHTMYTNGGWIGRVMPYLSNQLQGTEVWQLVDENTLQADIWIYDPEALEEPWFTRHVYHRMHEEPGQPLRLEYWWNCHSPNNMVTPTLGPDGLPDGGTTFLDFDFTDMDN